MGNAYCGPTNNHVGKKPRASHLKKPEPAKFKTIWQLTDEYLQTPPGSLQARELLQELLQR